MKYDTGQEINKVQDICFSHQEKKIDSNQRKSV